jgi:methylmalonyl-CoA/ethylmalonyl-CoA epimerase
VSIGIGGVAHVGVAVRSIEEALPAWTARLGFAHVNTVDFPPMKLRIAFLRAGDSEIELLEPTEPDSPVGRFLERRGEGVHHISFWVHDLESALARAAAAGLELIDRSPREGAHHTRIAFLHPRSLGGVLVELCERREP